LSQDNRTMTVPFKELGGSPVEHYSLDGFRARREFLVAWEDRDAFAAEALGTSLQHGGQTSVAYPGKASVLAVSVTLEPVDPANPDVQPLAELARGLNSYSGSFAKAAVEYRTATGQDRGDGPENEAGTRLTYRMAQALDTQKLLARGWKWADNPSVPVAEDLELVHAVPVTEHHLVWQQVIRPPWQAIGRLQGTVNSGEFLACAAGTLLFLGAEGNKLFRAGFEGGISDFCWEIHYVFREKAVKHGGAVYGWNHFYRDDPPGWVELTDGEHPLYEPADFTPLFQSATAP